MWLQNAGNENKEGNSLFLWIIKSLIWTMKGYLKDNVSPKIQRWFRYVMEFDLTLMYLEGKNNCVIDLLSRPPFAKTLEEETEVNVVDILEVDEKGEMNPQRKLYS